jgi:hypothetical protein
MSAGLYRGTVRLQLSGPEDHVMHLRALEEVTYTAIDMTHG